MPGFITRFGFFPGTETITRIEGVVIVDLPPPGSIEGIDTGVAALVGEFADMTFATDVDGTGAVTTSGNPQEIFTAQDLLDKVGGFDETIGDFGISGGNGFVAIRNKRFSRLIISPVNLSSGFGARYFRDLPLCTSPTDVLPAVPPQSASISAGREFTNVTGGRVRVGARVDFTRFEPFFTGIGGRTIAGAAAATQTFVSALAAEQVWQVNTAGTVFVDQTVEYNSAAVADFSPFIAAGQSVGDYAAFGMSSPFSSLTMDNTGGTPGVAGVVVWEYWDGTAWVALAGIADGTTSFTAGPALGQEVSWTVPADWATLALSGITKFYVRANIAATIFTTSAVYDSGYVSGPDLSQIQRPDSDTGIKKGDVVVIGNNLLGAVSPAEEAGTYRVNTDVPSGDDSIVLEQLDGSLFVWIANTGVPFRIHISTDADSAPDTVLGATTAGGYNATEGGGYSTPVRPLTDATGIAADGVYALGELLAPLVNPPPITGDTANPLSGLGCRLNPVNAVAFTVATQGINAASDATLDAAYATALDALISDLTPVASINMIWSARTSTTIRSLVKSNVGSASAVSLGRMGVIRPELTVQTTSAVVSELDPGVGANRTERVVYAWPGARTFIPEAVGTRIKLANGLTTFDGVLDVGWDAYVISLMSNLPPERNIGQAARPVPALLATVRGVQNGVTKLEINDYIVLRSRGIAALRMDRTVGPILQSGITTSLITGEKNIARRRMADFIQDSIARRLVQFTKLPLTTQNKDSAVVEVDAFMRELLSEDNPPAQRIVGFEVDDTSGNTPNLEAKGIFVIIVRVRTLASADFIVLQTEVGENVTFNTAA